MTGIATPWGVLGGGAWGTALAQAIAAHDWPVWLWAREAEVVESINLSRENRLYLPGVPLSPSIRASTELGDLTRSVETPDGRFRVTADPILVVTPAQHMRSVLAQLPQDEGGRLILCAKGIEAGTLLLMHEVAAELHPRRSIYVLSGPTFAREVAMGRPTAVTLANRGDAGAGNLADRLAQLARPALRPYLSDDVVGTEIGGAVKNVLAIACGVVDGAGLGQNARAALISRGFAEMTRFGLARGARAETLAGLSGLGDLVLTCSSTSSRNFSLGVGLGKGDRAADLLADRRSVAEGASTAPVLRQAAAQAGVEMPIVEAVCALLDGSATVDAVIGALLARPLRSEGG